ncbi:MAG TPA: DUF4091 domain-containing protein [Candidatus Hydrogenedentes bacterium]|nr:DUF4091 domain-containing protein [Candidatus Hydrogenedentota bacterium]HQH52501.1 DUF4091 domain-containing protein [Candidatus Hydrogenedentota bacterium]
MRFSLYTALIPFVAVLWSPCVAAAPVGSEDVEIETAHLKVTLPADGPGTVSWFGLRGSAHNQASGDGLLLEGFGVGSFYIPNRRLNVNFEVLEGVSGRPVLRYSYDCDGPNIAGLKSQRLIEPMPDEASLRVRWTVENAGTEDQWVAPWVRAELAAGGKLDAADRIDAPTLGGVRSIKMSGFVPASRNWIAVTDAQSRETVYAVFDAEHLHSFLIEPELDGDHCAIQAAYVPRLFKAKTTWETAYRVNMVRGLSHVDFATTELAAQVDYEPGRLTVLLAGTRDLPPLVIKTSILAQNGRVWKLEPKQFDLDIDTVVRCTYDWTAPADGPYDLVALFEKDGASFNLGEDLNVPHGAVDTQFCTGKAASWNMEAWTNAPHALDRQPRTLKRTMAARHETALWAEPALNKIFRDDQPVATGTVEPAVRVSLARNERESVQLVLRPPEGGDWLDVSLQIPDLLNGETNSRLSAENIRAYRVNYCPVTVPSHFEGPTGSWPDPLEPLTPFTARGGVCSPLWITVYAPPGTPPGMYRGLAELASSNGGPVEFWLEATVYDFELPQPPALKTDFGFWLDGALAMCKHMGYSGAAAQLGQAYLQDAAEHGVTLRDLSALPAESADYAASLAAYEKRLPVLQDGGTTTYAVPSSLLDAPEQLKMANAFVKGHDLSGRAFCHIGDGPPEPAWPRLFERMQVWLDTAPQIPMMVSTYGLQPFLSDAAQIWCVHLPMFDTVNGKIILERVQKGGEVWCYIDQSPPRPYANFFVDYAAIEHRALFWQLWALGVRGMHYWSVNSLPAGRDPRAGLVDITPVNGDGFLVYPSASGPVPSIRWEIIRDGIEDYGYLVLFRELQRRAEKSGNRALLDRVRPAADLGPVVPDLVTFTREPEVMMQKRDAIARAIVEMQKALAR